MTIQLIINADDFGLDHAVNAAVARAYKSGILTSASLVVTGSALRDALAVTRDYPELAVGLHLTLGDGRSARRRMRTLIEDQFRMFEETGLPLSHVDGHRNLHAHPSIMPIVVELAEKYGASGIRIPQDPFWIHQRVDGSRFISKAASAVQSSYFSWLCRHAIKKRSLVACDYSIGHLIRGQITGDYVIKMLGSINCESVEIVFHPSSHINTYGYDNSYGPNPGDLQALLNTKLADFIRENGYRLTTYPELKQR